jgi:hypothetical protein
MRIQIRSALIGLVLASTASGALATSALAKDFYTRKRVNGHWVYGEFPKKGSQAGRDQTTAQPGAQPLQAAASAEAAPAPAAPTSYGLGLHFPPQVQPAPATASAEVADVTTGSIRERRSRRHASRSERRAESRAARHEKVREADATPAPRRSAKRDEPAKIEPAAASKAAPVPREAAAPEARFASLPAPAPIARPVDPPVDPSKRLADALAVKAAALASGVITSAAEPIPQPKVEPVSVTYDYKTGIKTISYANGKVDEERFDPGTMKALAATAPAPAP